MTATTLTIYGQVDLVGKTVSALIGGLDCGDFVVAADGSISVPYGSDTDGLLTQAYLINLATNLPTAISFWGWGVSAVTLTLGGTNYTIPVSIGCAYNSDGQLPRPDAQHPGQNGPGLGKTRRIHWFSTSVVNACQMEFGAGFDATLLRPVVFPGNGLDANAHDTLFTGVYANPLNCAHDFFGQVAWRVNRPYPAQVGSVGSFIEMADR